MAEYIEREPMIEEMQRLIDNVSRNFPKATETELIILKGKYEAFMEYIKEQPVADVQPVAETENMATVSDEFICKKCGIYLKDYIKVVLDEDNEGYADELHYEYEPKYCPECGRKVYDWS